MQIVKLFLYHRDGRLRELNFRTGALNIVTGHSKTGKSALIKIVEYCLGAKEYEVPIGVIRDCTLWYGLLLQFPDTQVVVARPAPQPPNATTADMYIDVAAQLEIPSFEELTANTNVSACMDRLARMLGIVANLHEPPAGQTREPLEARLSHALIYCFQSQNEIADPDRLFHKQADEWLPQAIRDTLPFFLGTVGDDHLSKRREMRQLTQDIRRREQREREAEALQVQGSSVTTTLIEEASAIGLTPNVDTTNVVERLRSIAQQAGSLQVNRVGINVQISSRDYVLCRRRSAPYVGTHRNRLVTPEKQENSCFVYRQSIFYL